MKIGKGLSEAFDISKKKKMYLIPFLQQFSVAWAMINSNSVKKDSITLLRTSAF